LGHALLKQAHIFLVQRMQRVGECVVEEQIVLVSTQNPQGNNPRLHRATQVVGGCPLLAAGAAANGVRDADLIMN
jgi:hypothetical protein